MKKEILETLPHSAIEELIRLRQLITTLSSDNINFVTLRTFDDEPAQYEFIEILSGYAFVIREFRYDVKNRSCSYNIYKRPESISNMTGVAIPANFDNISDMFYKWLEDCEKMNKIKYRFLNPNSQFYEKEFENFFSNNDTDASTNPFELKRQEILFYFLTYTEKIISESSEINDETKNRLLEELSELKNDVPKTTKKVVVHRMSKFAEKIKNVSNKLFHDIFDVLKKELIKKVLYSSAEQIPNAVSKIEHWISLLG